MDILNEVNNGWIAFIAGVITSPHCVAMCGPLAFALLANPNAPKSTQYAHYGLYHSARIFSFTLVSALTAAFGLSILYIFQAPFTKIFPWVLILFLLIFAFGLNRFLPKPPILRKTFSNLNQRIFKLKKPSAALFLGLLTPLIPCGPLYMIFWLALLSGNPLFGASLGLGFAFGTLPLTFLMNTQLTRWQSKLLSKPKVILYIQRTVALLAAILLILTLLCSSDSPLQKPFCIFCPD